MHSRLSGLFITIAVLMASSSAVLWWGGYVCGAAAMLFTLPMALFTLWDFLDAERRVRRQGGGQEVGFDVTPVSAARRAGDADEENAQPPPAPSP